MREWLTNLDSWFSKIPRSANGGDCRYLCEHDKAEWCVWHEFAADEKGSCKLFDKCDGVDKDASRSDSERRELKRKRKEEEQQEGLKAGCNCQWANPYSCVPHANDASRCWGVCCSSYTSQGQWEQ